MKELMDTMIKRNQITKKKTNNNVINFQLIEVTKHQGCKFTSNNSSRGFLKIGLTSISSLYLTTRPMCLKNSPFLDFVWCFISEMTKLTSA
jgi:hypothetical protein